MKSKLVLLAVFSFCVVVASVYFLKDSGQTESLAGTLNSDELIESDDKRLLFAKPGRAVMQVSQDQVEQALVTGQPLQAGSVGAYIDPDSDADLRTDTGPARHLGEYIDPDSAPLSKNSGEMVNIGRDIPDPLEYIAQQGHREAQSVGEYIPDPMEWEPPTRLSAPRPVLEVGPRIDPDVD